MAFSAVATSKDPCIHGLLRCRCCDIERSPFNELIDQLCRRPRPVCLRKHRIRKWQLNLVPFTATKDEHSPGGFLYSLIRGELKPYATL